MKLSFAACVGSLLFLPFANAGHGAVESNQVAILRTADGGIQPQAAVDLSGGVHLIYYKGAPGGGDIFYAHQRANENKFSTGIRVNHRAGSAVAIGTIRGAQLAVGKSGRVHVVWNGGSGAARVMVNGRETTPLLYSRMNDAGTAFEPERNIITYAAGLDGGSSVAADNAGNVYVAWHGQSPENTNGEAGRGVFVATSRDEGKTFERERSALAKVTGACSCCSLRAFADSGGKLNILYRAATEGTNRDEILLVARQPADDFQMTTVDKWKATMCPMSSASLSQGSEGLLAAWETSGRVYFARIEGTRISNPTSPPGNTKRKHPVVVANQKGDVLLAWTEGTGWNQGGAVAWQVYDANGKAISEEGRAEGLPVWSLATAFARPDGNFVIVY